MAKFKMICPVCGSDEISSNATVRWNVETQQWEATAVYDEVHCDECEADSDHPEQQEIA